jgi:hypothetical protein
VVACSYLSACSTLCPLTILSGISRQAGSICGDDVYGIVRLIANSEERHVSDFTGEPSKDLQTSPKVAVFT